MNEREDVEIKTALESNLHSEEPSEELMRNLRVMAKKPVRSHKAWWQSKLAWAGTVAAIAAIGALTLMPTKASAKTYDRILQAAGSIDAFQFLINDHKDGKHGRVSIAGSEGNVCITTDEGTVFQVNKGVMKTYDPAKNTVTEMNLGGFIDQKTIMEGMKAGMSEAMKEMDLKQMLKDYEQKYGRDHIDISGAQEENGRKVYYVTLDDKEGKNRVEMTVDYDKDLPVRIAVEGKNDEGTWTQETLMEMRFGAEVDPADLEGNIPANAKREEMDVGDMIGDAFKEMGAHGKLDFNGKEFSVGEKPKTHKGGVLGAEKP